MCNPETLFTLQTASAIIPVKMKKIFYEIFPCSSSVVGDESHNEAVQTQKPQPQIMLKTVAKDVSRN